MDLKPIILPYKSLAGISAQQISEHYEVLYKGYVKKVNAIREKIKSVAKDDANPTYSEIRELKLEESFALDAVKLHEAYFLGLGGDGVAPLNIKRILAKDFGSFENWENEFRATGMTARGWTVLFHDHKENRLQISLADFHSHGAIWDATPVLVLDTYEHAYFIDYGTKRKDYIDSWFKNLNWQQISKNLDLLGY